MKGQIKQSQLTIFLYNVLIKVYEYLEVGGVYGMG